MKATDIRNGQGIKMDGKLFVVHSFEHRTPGNLRAFIQVKLRDVIGGSLIEKRLSSSDELEAIDLDRRPMEFLYKDGEDGVFMDNETYEQVTVNKGVLGDALLYLPPNTAVVVMVYDNKPVLIELPSSVELTIIDTPPGIKGATATNQLKEAECETGLKTKVPPFIVTGEKIRISTTDGSYQSRA